MTKVAVGTVGNEPAAGEARPLEETLAELSTQIGNAVEAQDKTVEAQEKYTRALRRRSYVLGGGVVVALAAAVAAWVVLVGTVSEQGRQQARLRQQTLASCGEHANQAKWEAFAAGQAAERAQETPGVTPTVHWLITDLSEQARVAYEQGGCVEHLGPLPMATPSGTPTK